LIAANSQDSDSAKFALHQEYETTANPILCIAAEVASHCGVWCYYIEETSLILPQRKQLFYCFILFRVFTYVLQVICMPLTVNDVSVFPEG
jgi:hypothetical protein